MIIDGIELTETGEITSAIVASGSDFPATPIEGLLFVLDTDIIGYDKGLYYYNGTDWVTGDITGIELVGDGFVGVGGTTGAISIELDFVVIATHDDIDAHAAETTHLTPTERTWLDNIAATYVEVNRLIGVTGPIQSQLDNKMSVNDSGAVRQLLGKEDAISEVFVRTPEYGILPYNPSSSKLGTDAEQFLEVNAVDFVRNSVRIPTFTVDTVAPVSGGVDGDVWFVI